MKHGHLARVFLRMELIAISVISLASLLVSHDR